MTRDYPAPVEGLVVEHDGPVLRLRLDRPERRNALTDAIVQALTDAVEAAGSDESVRVVALSATGEHFCSGFDLAGRSGGGEKPRIGSTQRRMRWQVNRLVPTFLETQTPIVVACTGATMGLGLHVALAADFAVVATDARLRAPFTTMGFTPDSGGSWLVPRLVGVARAADWGMVHRAVPADEVAATAEALVQELAAAPTVAVGLAKLLIQRSTTVDLERHLADEALAIELSSRSEDFHEYHRSRRERRDPGFTGR